MAAHLPVLSFSLWGVFCLAGCGGLGLREEPISACAHVRSLAYAPQHVIAHACERLLDDQGGAFAIHIVEPRVYGLEDKKAIVYGNYHVITDSGFAHIPRAYALLLKTTDRGRTWTQVLDPVGHRVGDVSELRFFDDTHGWLAWQNHIEDPSFGMLRTYNGGATWEESRFHDVGAVSILEAWAFSSPWNGECVAAAMAPVPFEGNLEKEVAFWRMRTEDGGRNWCVTKTVAVDDVTEDAAARTAPEHAWRTPSSRWAVKRRGDSFAVLYLDEQSRWEEVLSLPHTPYRADDAESLNRGSEQSKPK